MNSDKPDCTTTVPEDPAGTVDQLVASQFVCTDGSTWPNYRQAIQREQYLKLERLYPVLTLLDRDRFTDVDFEEFHRWALDNANWLREYARRVLEDK